MTGLPFIYAAWTGRAGAVDRTTSGAAGGAGGGRAARLAIAAEYGRGDAAARGAGGRDI